VVNRCLLEIKHGHIYAHENGSLILSIIVCTVTIKYGSSDPCMAYPPARASALLEASLIHLCYGSLVVFLYLREFQFDKIKLFIINRLRVHQNIKVFMGRQIKTCLMKVEEH